MKSDFHIMLIIITLYICCGCGEQSTKPLNNQNPLLETWNTPYNVPPFDKIKPADYIPAFQQAIKEHDAEIEAIIKVMQPDFYNVILAFDCSGKNLNKISNVFFNVNEAETNNELDAISEMITTMMTEHSDKIMLNESLFAKIKAVYAQRHEMNLEPDQIRLTEKFYEDFIRSGADLASEDKEILKDINVQLAPLCLRFGKNILADTKNFKMVIEDASQLEGLPEDIKTAAAVSDETENTTKWVFTADKPSWIPFLQYSPNRELREKLYKGWFMRGDNNNENDTKAIIDTIVNLRLKKAQLLGYKNYAAYHLAVNMSKTPENLMALLDEIWKVALPAAEKERDAMQKMIDLEKKPFKMQSWDWWYYAEKNRKSQFDIDENEMKPYFSIENAKKGIFYVANRLYGITFERTNDLPLYHRDVETYIAKEKDGKIIGILYMDYYVRAGKRGGAWCTDFRKGSYDEKGNRIYPVVSVVCNFNPPVGNSMALLSWDDNTTLFHEFGHALHSLFADGHFNRITGDMPHDMVELPSQVLERWAAEPEVLNVYAKHFQTGETIPSKLVQKMQKSNYFNKGFETTEYVAASILDMKWHTIEQNQEFDVNAFEQKVLSNIHLIPQILPRYRSTYFNHIFAGDSYAAGYGDYCWAEVLDADAFDAFKQSGDIFNPVLAEKFRKHILTECGEGEGLEQYIKFRGQEPLKLPYFKNRGLK